VIDSKECHQRGCELGRGRVEVMEGKIEWKSEDRKQIDR
jgi:hypothetical protein